MSDIIVEVEEQEPIPVIEVIVDESGTNSAAGTLMLIQQLYIQIQELINNGIDPEINPQNQIILLGEIGAVAIEEYINSLVPAISVQANFLRIFKLTDGGLERKYLYTGPGGLLGDNQDPVLAEQFHSFSGTIPSVNGDTLLVSDPSSANENQTFLNVVLNNIFAQMIATLQSTITGGNSFFKEVDGQTIELLIGENDFSYGGLYSVETINNGQSQSKIFKNGEYIYLDTIVSGATYTSQSVIFSGGTILFRKIYHNDLTNDNGSITVLALDPHISAPVEGEVQGTDVIIEWPKKTVSGTYRLATIDDILLEAQAALDLKLNIEDYNDRYLGKYTSLVLLESAHPSANAGDYAQVDTGGGSAVVNYSYDVEDGWIEGSAGSGATDTDMLPEGATNLYHTAARVLATVLTGLGTPFGVVVSTDTILQGIGKLQRQISDHIALAANFMTYPVFTSGTSINFNAARVYGHYDAPLTGSVSIVFLNAKLITQRIYHQDTVAPNFPSGGGAVHTIMGQYVPNTLNIIDITYCLDSSLNLPFFTVKYFQPNLPTQAPRILSSFAGKSTIVNTAGNNTLLEFIVPQGLVNINKRIRANILMEKSSNAGSSVTFRLYVNTVPGIVGVDSILLGNIKLLATAYSASGVRTVNIVPDVSNNPFWEFFPTESFAISDESNNTLVRQESAANLTGDLYFTITAELQNADLGISTWIRAADFTLY